MIDEISLTVIQKGVSVIIESDVIYHLGHGGVVDFNADDPDKMSVMIDGNIIGKHPRLKIFRNVGRQPDAFSGGPGHREPDQLGGVTGIIAGNIRNLMLLKTAVSGVNVPEARDIPGKLRINAIVIGQNSMGVMLQLLKDIPDPIRMNPELFVICAREIKLREGTRRQIGFRIGPDGFDRLFRILKKVIQILLSGFA